MPIQTIAYLRVTNSDQDFTNQLHLKKQADRTFEEVASGKTMNRPELRKLFGYMREGDTVIVRSIDRLSTSMSDLLLHILPEFENAKVAIHFEHEQITIKPDEKLNIYEELRFNIMAGFAELGQTIRPSDFIIKPTENPNVYDTMVHQMLEAMTTFQQEAQKLETHPAT